MRNLQRNEIDKVDEKFRPMVLKEWQQGRDVPFEVTLVGGYRPLTESEIAFGKSLEPMAVNWLKNGALE